MPLNLASPGILIREVDLTQGRVDPTSDKIGGIVGAFAKGPVGTPVRINTEKDLVDTFGQPYNTDKQYETWMVASSYLSYGGIMNIIRADKSDLKNAHNAGAGTSLKVRSIEHYEELGYDFTPKSDVTVFAKNPGSWANDIRVAIIDSQADQRLGIDTTAINSGTDIAVGMGITQAIPSGTVVSNTGTGAGTTSLLDGHLKGIITQVNSGTVDVKVVSHVSAGGTHTTVDYNNVYKFVVGSGSTAVAIHTAGQSVSYGTTEVTSAVDWFGEQTLAVSSQSVGGSSTITTVKWNTLADAPGTSSFAAARGARNDELHVVVIDGNGEITGNAGTILEKHLNLSKASDAEYSVGSPAYWNTYLKNNSQYIFAGSASDQTFVKTGFDGVGFTTFTDGGWNQKAEDVDGPNIFDATGPLNLVLSHGKNYNDKSTVTEDTALKVDLGDVVSGYGLFENESEVDVDFLLMGSAAYDAPTARALATKLIQVAETRKDAVAFISPYRSSIITDTAIDTADTINSVEDSTNKIIDFFDPLTSSSYAVFDSGYKYMYDRFNNTFRYVPLNGDIAGTCARNDINNFPWFSPAGTSRGTILNAVKLAYNPGKLQRDRLYSSRINPVIFSPGSGIILFGDKTGFGKASAFDRINVRRLFIFLEDTIAAAARDQLFEFNDEITRANFVNIVEPFLRDVQAKRGIQDFVVICDETNNTAAIIDSNEFVADIYIKPARSINFIGLNFIATRTGVAFEEVIGSV
jgi:hypothetical protein